MHFCMFNLSEPRFLFVYSYLTDNNNIPIQLLFHNFYFPYFFLPYYLFSLSYYLSRECIPVFDQMIQDV